MSCSNITHLPAGKTLPCFDSHSWCFFLLQKKTYPRWDLGQLGGGGNQNCNARSRPNINEAFVLFLFPSRAGSSPCKGSSWAASAKVSLKSKHLCFSQNKSTACNPEPVGKLILTAEHSCDKLQPWCLLIPLRREKGQTGKVTLENLFWHIRESSIPLTRAIPADRPWERQLEAGYQAGSVPQHNILP